MESHDNAEISWPVSLCPAAPAGIRGRSGTWSVCEREMVLGDCERVEGGGWQMALRRAEGGRV